MYIDPELAETWGLHQRRYGLKMSKGGRSADLGPQISHILESLIVYRRV